MSKTIPATIKRHLHHFLTLFIASVWLINGLFCKVLNLVPRHRQIVGRILGNEYAEPLTKMIGLSEIIMTIWIIIGIKSRLNAVIQMLVIATMNVLEFLLVPDLLLFGKMNAIIAALLIIIIYLNEFILNKKSLNDF